MATEVKGTARNFVYQGGRTGKNNIPLMKIQFVEPENKLAADTLSFKSIRRGPTIIGGIYTGVLFDGSTAFGLETARYVGMWEGDQTLVASWRALNYEHEQEMAAIRNQKKYVAPLEKTLLPLRQTMHAMRLRGMHHEAHNYMQMIIAEMYRPLRKNELEE